MTEVEVFILADEALNRVVSQISDKQWGMQLPGWFQLGHTPSNPTLRDIINYHAYDEAWVPETLAGKSITEVEDKYDDDLLGAEPKIAFARFTDAGIAAARALNDPERIVHLSYGDFPAREYLKHITSFRGFRAYDIATLIGVNNQLPDNLVQGMWDEIAPEVEQWRAMGVFGPAITIPKDASLQDRLLGLAGRDPYRNV